MTTTEVLTAGHIIRTIQGIGPATVERIADVLSDFDSDEVRMFVFMLEQAGDLLTYPRSDGTLFEASPRFDP